MTHTIIWDERILLHMYSFLSFSSPPSLDYVTKDDDLELLILFSLLWSVAMDIQGVPVPDGICVC